MEKKPLFFIGLLVLVGFISHLQWFNPFSILNSSDWSFWSQQAVKELWFSWGTWVPFFNTGGANIQLPFLGFITIWSFLAQIGASYDFAVKITFLIPIAVLGFIAPYVLVKHLFANNPTAFGAALFYGSTTYFLIRQTAHLPVAMVYALAPLILYFFMKATEKNRLFDWGMFSVIYSIGVIYEVRIMLIVSLILLLYLAIFYNWKSGLSKYKVSSIGLLLIIGLNTFWILPTILGSGGHIANVVSRGLFGNALFDITHALTLHDSSWTGSSPNQMFIPQEIQIYYWIIPMLAFSALLMYKKFDSPKRKLLIFFGLISIIGIFLTKQSDAPVEGAYQALYDTLPGFALFREASKFYLLTAFGYLGLISLSLIGAYRNKRIIFYGLLVLVTGLSLFNLKPLITGEMSTLFVPRQIPSDYLVLNDFLQDQPDFFRTYWVPNDSRWGIHTANHPKISGAGIVQSDWEQLAGTDQQAGNIVVQNKIVSMFTQSHSENLLASASVKYVVVPLRDKANDDDFFIHYGNDRQFYIGTLDKVDFLRRIDIGTKDLVVYENKNFKPHISAQSKLIGLDNFDNLSKEYKFLQSNGSKEANFYLSKKTDDIPSAKLKSLFSDPQIDISAGSLSVLDYLSLQKNAPAKLYKNRNVATLSYKAAKNNLEISTKALPSPSLNGKQLSFSGAEENKIIDRTALKQNQRYFLQVDDSATPVVPDKSSSLGRIDKNTQIELHTAGKNLIPNPSFEQGLWQQEVGDCNNYDANAKLNMTLNTKEGNRTDGTQSLRLEATRHAACTGINLQLDSSGNRLLSFDYQSPDSKQAGYNLQFNDAKKTAISVKLPIRETSQWQTVTKNLDVPTGATEAVLTVYAYESDRRAKNTVFYDNFSLSQTELVKTIKLPSAGADFEPVDVTLNSGDNTFELNSTDYNGSNIIENPSFEDGLWSKSVGDCNAYDNKPDITSSLDTSHKTDGGQSLRLEAIRHIACTSKDIDIMASGDHLLSFDVQGQDTKQAGYNIQFNDDKKTVISERIDIQKPNKWQEFKKKIKVPAGASSASLTIYAYESDGKTKNIARYDNFKFIKIPDLGNTYYFLTEAEQELRAPEQISHTSINPTKKSISIGGATKPFALSFSESFHPGWKLYMRPINDKPGCKPVRTSSDDAASKNIECQSQQKFMQGDELDYLRQRPVFDNEHFKLNGYANGWIVDPAYIKANYGPEYYRENPDGSIDMNLVAYFKPQSYFYIGLVISGTTLIACIAYLVRGATTKKRKQYTVTSKRIKASAEK